MYETNSIIKASAGTGKTFALATRFIRLMLLDNVEPQKIVALTFSRAAAQEIYTKILDRLCDAAQDEASAEKEWNNLLEDFKNNAVPQGSNKYVAICLNPPSHTAKDFAKLLRKLIDTQHLGAIATLDSFILKMVQIFPKEMGFQNAVSVLDEKEEHAAVKDAARQIFTKKDDIEELRKYISLAKKGENTSKSIGFIEGISSSVLCNFVVNHPECVNWTVEGMCESLGIPPIPETFPDLSTFPKCQIQRKNTTAPEENLIKKLTHFCKSDGFSDLSFLFSGIISTIVERIWKESKVESFSYKFYNRDYTNLCGAENAQKMHDAISYAIILFFRRQVEIIHAKIQLALKVDNEFGKNTRKMGKLTFNDVTKYPAQTAYKDRGISLQNVEFRFDTKFNHWALDEFQDTSELQWRCLYELVNSAANGSEDDRTAMAVGDMKQSIYTWRGASAQPFEDISSWQEFDNCKCDLAKSYRYGKNITTFINKVFSNGNISVGLIPDVCKPATEAWQNGWVKHISNGTEDYIKVISADEAADEALAGESPIYVALYNEIKPLWEKHEENQSTETVGILVRNNDHGTKIADYLRTKGLPVVWEGVSSLGNIPIAQAVLSLLKLSAHPSDVVAWKMVSEVINITSILYPEKEGLNAVSQAVSESLTKLGIARTIKEYTNKLRGELEKDSLSITKLQELVDLAVTFENRQSYDGSIDTFIDFVDKSTKRDIATSSSVIRILTIHRSKGLGIDHVFVPFIESSRTRIDKPNNFAPIFKKDGNWILPHIKEEFLQFNEDAEKAYKTMCNETFAENLRTYYVALTRAKKSMYVIITSKEDSTKQEKNTKQKKDDSDKKLLFSDIIRSAIRGDEYTCGKEPEFASKASEQNPHKSAPWEIIGTRNRIARVSPSRSAKQELQTLSASILFGEDFGKGAKLGVEVHATFQEIEWLNDTNKELIPEAFNSAFVKPSPTATLWRERSYELLLDNEWETGQFDRVVFEGEGTNRTATIYDFKTNRKWNNETDEAFATRMKDTYTPQMSSYKRALSALTSIPESNIKTILLLNTTKQPVEL